MLPERVSPPLPLIRPERVPTPPGSLMVVVPLVSASEGARLQVGTAAKVKLAGPAPVVVKIRALPMALLPVSGVVAPSVPPASDKVVGPNEELPVAK